FEAEKARARNLADAAGAAGERAPVDEHEADDLAESQSDDGQIIAAQTQDRKAEDDAEQRGDDAGDRQAYPERHAEIHGQQSEGIGADRVEGDIAEIEQAGE